MVQERSFKFIHLYFFNFLKNSLKKSEEEEEAKKAFFEGSISKIEELSNHLTEKVCTEESAVSIRLFTE